jgi:tetratricopeptide (TPR) repeat protein
MADAPSSRRLVLSNAERHGDAEMAGWAHLLLGRSSADLGDWDAGERRFERAREIFSRLANWRAVALAHNSLGVLAEYRGDPSAAEEQYRTSLEIIREHGESSDEAVVLLNSGSVLGTIGRWGEAREALERSLAIRRTFSDSFGIASALLHLTIVHSVQGAPDEALRCADEALTWCRGAGDQVAEHAILLARSEVYRRSKRQANAMSDAQAAWAIAQADCKVVGSCVGG